MSSVDSQLLARWQSGEAEAFTEIVRLYSGLVYRAGCRILRDPHLAEDLTQDCFLTLLKRRIVPAVPIAAWLHRVATNRAISWLRSSESRSRREEATAHPEPASDLDPAWVEARTRIDAEIEALPDELREPLVAHFLGGQTHEEISAARGVPRRTVSHRIGRALEQVRARLQKSGITLSIVALTAGLSEEAQAELPPSLRAELGRMAIASRMPAAQTPKPSPRLRAGALAGIVLLAVGFAIWLATRPETPAEPREVAETRAVEPEVDVEPMQQIETSSPQSRSEPQLVRPEGTIETSTRRETVARASVEGSVLDEAGRGIAGAEVVLLVERYGNREFNKILAPDQVQRQRTRVTRSDAAGSYRFEDVPWLGTGMVSAYREGFGGARLQVTLEEGSPVEGLDITLPTGTTFTGQVLDPAGQPVTDAVVSILEAYSAKDMTFGWGFSRTDGEGRFRLGLHVKATLATVRVNSEVHGQEIFQKVPVREPALLVYRPRATLRGHMRSRDGAPATGLQVCVQATLPDPDIPVTYTGLRPHLVLEAIVDAAGVYEIDRITPGLTYDISAGQAGPANGPFTPFQEVATGEKRWKPEPGEVKEWSAEVTPPARVLGRVRTESGRAAVELPVHVSRDGTVIWQLYRQTDAEGCFEIGLIVDGGEYELSVGAGRSESDALASEIIAPSSGERIALELTVPDPLVLPIRVLDSDGAPIESIRYQLDFERQGPDLKSSSSMRLDAEGRAQIEIWMTFESVQLEVHEFPDGLPQRSKRLPVPRSGRFDEIVFHLERSITLTGRVLVSQGPLAESTVQVEIRRGEQTEKRSVRTSKDGRFEARGLTTAGWAEIRITAEAGTWRAERSVSVGDTFDLGEIWLE
ncbi:MAG: sigma-70 family RNA polymerase sigma factor [Planctomycetota bacterium]